MATTQDPSNTTLSFDSSGTQTTPDTSQVSLVLAAAEPVPPPVADVVLGGSFITKFGAFIAENEDDQTKKVLIGGGVVTSFGVFGAANTIDSNQGLIAVQLRGAMVTKFGRFVAARGTFEPIKLRGAMVTTFGRPTVSVGFDQLGAMLASSGSLTARLTVGDQPGESLTSSGQTTAMLSVRPVPITPVSFGSFVVSRVGSC